MMSIGENIKSIRVKKGISRKELSKILSIKESTIQSYELDRRKAPVDMLTKIATALNVNINDLLKNDLPIDENIKKHRQKCKFTQEELSKKLEISKHTLSKYEQGQRKPTTEMLKKIANALNISIVDLLAEKDTLFQCENPINLTRVDLSLIHSALYFRIHYLEDVAKTIEAIENKPGLVGVIGNIEELKELARKVESIDI